MGAEEDEGSGFHTAEWVDEEERLFRLKCIEIAVCGEAEGGREGG